MTQNDRNDNNRLNDIFTLKNGLDFYLHLKE